MTTLPFFTSLLILLIVARVFGEVCERFRQPSMLGEILAGVLLGPMLLSIIQPTESIYVISELGIFLLVILAGLEFDINEVIKSLRGRNIFIPIVAFALPLVSGFMLGRLFEFNTVASLFIGLCISVTALPISIRILMDMNIINTDTAQKIISAAIIQDILALTILGIIVNIPSEEFQISVLLQSIALTMGKLILFIALLSLAYVGSNKLARRSNIVEEAFNRSLSLLKGKESLLAVFFLFVLVFATIAEMLGFHFIIGAFFASMLINKKVIGQANHDTIEKSTSGLTMGFLSPIFFAYIGLKFNLMAIGNIWLLVAVLAVASFSKILGGFLGGKIARLSKQKSLTLGIGLNGHGIMEIIIADIAYEANLINAELFSIVVLMCLISVIITPILLKKSYERIPEGEK